MILEGLIMVMMMVMIIMISALCLIDTPNHRTIRHKNLRWLKFHNRHKNQAVVEFQGQQTGRKVSNKTRNNSQQRHQHRGYSYIKRPIYKGETSLKHVACNIKDKCTIPRAYKIYFFLHLLIGAVLRQKGSFARSSLPSQFDLSSQCHTG